MTVVDYDSKLKVSVGDSVALIRDWATYRRDQIAKVVKLVECSQGDYVRWNARVVLEDEPAEDEFFHRTMPAELLRPLWTLGEYVVLDVNQGDRDRSVIAIIEPSALVEYDMPAGRTYLAIVPHRGAKHIAIARKSLPKKWITALES